MYTHSLRSTVLLALFAGAVVLPTRLVAQAFADTIVAPASTWTTSAPATETSNAAKAVAPSGARMAPVAVTSKSMSYAPVDNTSLLAPSTGEHVGQSRAMMGAGAVALIVGLIIGGDVGTIVAVGGAAFALVGLYRYMQ